MLMNKQQRMARLAEEDNLLRLMQLQIRLNTSIENNDVESAQRLMQSYLKPANSPANSKDLPLN